MKITLKMIKIFLQLNKRYFLAFKVEDNAYTGILGKERGGEYVNGASSFCKVVVGLNIFYFICTTINVVINSNNVTFMLEFQNVYTLKSTCKDHVFTCLLKC